MKIKSMETTNGIRIINVERESAMVSIKIIVNVGAKDEDDSNRGVAHLLEHMLFKGTTTRSDSEIMSLASNCGIALNAGTSNYITRYIGTAMAEDAECIFDIFSDALNNSIFDQDKLDKEIDIVCQEILQLYQNRQRLFPFKNAELIFEGEHRKHHVIGSAESVKGISREKLVEFYNKFYVADNLTVVVAGGVAMEKTAELVNKYFANMRRGQAKQILPDAYKGGFLEGNTTEGSNKISVAFEINKEQNFMAVQVLSNILGGSAMFSRLFARLRSQKGLVYSISTTFTSSATPIFYIMADTSSDNVDEVIKEIALEINEIKHTAISDDELQRAKKSLNVSLAIGLESNETIANILADSKYSSGELFDPEEEKKKLREVCVEDVCKVAQAIFNTKPAYFISGKVDKKPSYEELCKMLEQ